MPPAPHLAILRSAAFAHGARALLPATPGIATFGMIVGVATVGSGFHPIVAMLFTLIAYAGSAQLVAVQMFTAGVPVPVIIGAALVVNLRFIIYSLAMSPFAPRMRHIERAGFAYLLSDHAFGLIHHRYSTRPDDPDNWSYALGSSLVVWLAWQVGGLAGILAGAAVPPGWSLEFTVTLTFLAMAIGAIRDLALGCAAVAAGAVAVAAWSLPLRSGLILAIIAGILVGLAIDALRGAAAGKAA